MRLPYIDGGGQAKGVGGLLSLSWPDQVGQMKGDLGLMSSCHKGHRGNQHPSALFDGTLNWTLCGL